MAGSLATKPDPLMIRGRLRRSFGLIEGNPCHHLEANLGTPRGNGTGMADEVEARRRYWHDERGSKGPLCIGDEDRGDGSPIVADDDVSLLRSEATANNINCRTWHPICRAEGEEKYNAEDLVAHAT